MLLSQSGSPAPWSCSVGSRLSSQLLLSQAAHGAEQGRAGQEDELHAWSERGRVNTSTWPFSFHSVLSCMLGTCTLTVTGPYGKTQIKCLRPVITQHQTKYLFPYLGSSVNTLKCVYRLLHCSHNKTFSWISLPFVCHLSSTTRTDSVAG